MSAIYYDAPEAIPMCAMCKELGLSQCGRAIPLTIEDTKTKAVRLVHACFYEHVAAELIEIRGMARYATNSAVESRDAALEVVCFVLRAAGHHMIANLVRQIMGGSSETKMRDVKKLLEGSWQHTEQPRPAINGSEDVVEGELTE